MPGRHQPPILQVVLVQLNDLTLLSASHQLPHEIIEGAFEITALAFESLLDFSFVDSVELCVEEELPH
jgi:hypothetical protein